MAENKLIERLGYQQLYVDYKLTVRYKNTYLRALLVGRLDGFFDFLFPVDLEEIGSGVNLYSITFSADFGSECETAFCNSNSFLQ